MSDTERLEKAIDDAFTIATTHNLTSVSDGVRNHFKFTLKQIAIAAIESVQNEQNSHIFELKRHLSNV